MQEIKERIAELEISITHQARQVEELSNELLECNRRVARLEKENAGFRRMFESLAPKLTESPDE